MLYYFEYMLLNINHDWTQGKTKNFFDYKSGLLEIITENSCLYRLSSLKYICQIDGFYFKGVEFSKYKCYSSEMEDISRAVAESRALADAVISFWDEPSKFLGFNLR